MLGNAIKQTTATTGTGNLTMSAVTDYPTVANVFAVNQLLAYSLLNAAGLFLEAGVGYLSDATTLVRARVCATFTGGVYNDKNPTALSLTGTTTVICTPHAATMESQPPTVDPNATLRIVSSAHRISTLGAITAAANRLYYVPFLFRNGGRVTSLVVNITTAVAASKAQGGIYLMTPDGVPGVLLASTGDVDSITTGLRVVTLAQPLFLPSGWYYMAFCSSHAVAATGYGTGPNNILGGMPLGYNTAMASIEHRYDTLTAGWVNLPPVANNPTSGVYAAGNFGQPMTFPGVA